MRIYWFQPFGRRVFISGMLILLFLFFYSINININISASFRLTAVSSFSNPEVLTPPEEYPGIWVEHPGNLTHRLKKYLTRLEQLRMRIWSDRGATPWKEFSRGETLQVIDPRQPFYLRNITKVKEVKTLFLKRLPIRTGAAYWTSKGDYENLLVTTYYHWAVDRQVCEWVKIKGLSPEGWSYTPKCSSEISGTLSPGSLDVQSLNLFESFSAIYNEWYKPVLDKPPPYVAYVHIVQDAVVSEIGDVYSGSLKFSPYPCNFKGPTQMKPYQYDDTVIHKEVFTIAQIYGRSIYHRNIDQLPRVAAYLDFLRKYPQIKVHIGVDKGGMTFEILRLLGIATSRVIQWVTRAHVVYVPEGCPCGMINVLNTQLLSSAYSKVIASNWLQESTHSVIFINRTGTRRLRDNTVIYKMVEELADKYKLDLEVFGDNPAPPITDSMRMFNRAVMVVAPHGAGLFNILFCRPKTYVVEVN